MKRFKFSLQAVQTVRNQAAQAALETLARATRARSVAEAALAEAEQALGKQILDWRQAMAKGFSPGDMLQHEHMRAMLEARRNERTRELKEASNAASQAQAAFQLARQKSEVVERFHDRQRRDFNLAVLKEEQHLLDDLASSRHELGIFGAAHA